MRRNQHHRLGFTLVQLLVLIGIVALIISILLPIIRRTRERNTDFTCARNLRLIGQALLLYSNENGGHYPRTAYAGGPVVAPVWGTGAAASNPFAPGGPQPNDVSAALFLLIRTQDIGSGVFTCPQADSAKDDFGGGKNTAANRSNFTNLKKNLSYSFANPYPNDAAVKAKYKLRNGLSAEFAVAADMNPGTKGPDHNVLAVTPSSSTTEMKVGNSKNHDGDGQNVLFGDGHVEFVNNPFVGVNHDNIYATKDNQVAASPVDDTDSVLLPTGD